MASATIAFLVLLLGLAHPSDFRKIPGAGYTKLLVTTGYASDFSDIPTEVIDLADPNTHCEFEAGFYRTKFKHSAAGLISDEVPILCGGRDGFSIKDCYRIGVDEPIFPMIQGRYDAASVVLDDGTLWVTGGEDFINFRPIRFDSTELVTLSGSTLGPDLPEGITEHCLVLLDSSTAFLIGGFHNSYLSTSWYFDLANPDGGWTRGPDLRQARSSHSCGVVRDAETDDLVVVVAGGYAPTGPLASTEVMKVGENSWSSGPDLPMSVFEADGVETADRNSFLLVGGSERGVDELTSIFEFKCSGGDCSCTKMDQELVVGRYSHVAMLIPDTLAACTDI